ncbi:prepilin-type N-terminal cleavage/methylation domain-containing protein [Colwellia sp. TT2012]|uniref:prepilin-type N-terminal cleavage/methylation domain-containing protein n=1 Tax=Colwellia sp. TT2012 TaxID=1720342 RepID=UPI00070B4CC5|nr:prepilin-type N-terminal cleavage/methylation domain-containing protein [Colwellia sp. TT2012]
MAFNNQSLNFRQRLNSKQALKFKQRGFTLVELIIGIVVLSLSLSIVSTLIAPAEEKSADNVLQIKASELGQSLMNDIMSRAFADNSDMAGGRFRCNEAGQDNCTEPLGRDGSEGDNRTDYNDVDDFNGYEIEDDVLDPLDSSYDNFIVAVNVVYAGDDLGLADKLAKRITVTVTTPLGTAIKFTSHKANF